MSWIIIIGVFILAAGPLFYLMPTAKDKRLTALRMNARQLGFTIQLDTLLKLDPTADERVTAGGQARSKKVECMRYQLAMGQTLDYVPPITLQRIPAATNIPVTVVMEGWGLPAETASNSRQAESHTNNVEAWQRQGELLKPIRTLLLALPEDVLGIAIDGRCVGAFWLERSGKQNVNKTLPETVIEPLQSIHTTLRKVIEIVKSHPWDLG